MTRHTLALDDRLLAYLLAQGTREHPAQRALRELTLPLPRASMQIAPEQAQLLGLLLRLIGARRAIEVGVYTGYSALTAALALPPDGHLLACDISDADTRLGMPLWRAAGVEHKIEFVVAPADQTLQARLAAGEAGRYDFAFIDADKAGYDRYYELCLQLLRPGGVVALDNVLWSGRVAQPASDDADTQALQALNIKIQADPRVDMAMLPIGDGLTVALKR